jgi:translation initiation factor 2B subunit (eIF-2B alpha/beta/delta family)
MQKSIRHTSRQLFVPLTPEQKEDQVKDMLDILQAKNEVEYKIDGLKDQIKKHNANLETLEENLKDTAHKIKHGILSDVPCKTILDWIDKHITVFRKDTFEVVEDRDMTENDHPLITDEVEETETVENK